MNTVITLQMSADELETLIKRAIREESQKAILPPEKDKHITRKEAKQILNISSDTTILSYEKRGLISPRKAGKKIVYLESDIKNAMTKIKRS